MNAVTKEEIPEPHEHFFVHTVKGDQISKTHGWFQHWMSARCNEGSCLET